MKLEHSGCVAMRKNNELAACQCRPTWYQHNQYHTHRQEISQMKIHSTLQKDVSNLNLPQHKSVSDGKY